MSSNASLNAQAVASDGRNWMLTIALDGATALYCAGEKMASLDAASAVKILSSSEDADERMEELLTRLEEASESIDPHARNILLNNSVWLDAHWE